jgi:urease subunit gamma/beta
MYLSPADEERLRIFTAAELARRTLERGLALNVPEAIALACDEMHLAARAGAAYDEVAAAGRAAVRADQLLPGVAGLVDEISLEVLLGDGTRLVVLRDPWAEPGGDGDGGGAPGAITVQDGEIELHAGLEHRRLLVRNSSAKPVRVASHFPFWRANPRLEFDRAAAAGCRLALPSGHSVRWDAGEAKEIDLVRVPGLAEHLETAPAESVQ